MLERTTNEKTERDQRPELDGTESETVGLVRFVDTMTAILAFQSAPAPIRRLHLIRLENETPG